MKSAFLTATSTHSKWASRGKLGEGFLPCASSICGGALNAIWTWSTSSGSLFSSWALGDSYPGFVWVCPGRKDQILVNNLLLLHQEEPSSLIPGYVQPAELVGFKKIFFGGKREIIVAADVCTSSKAKGLPIWGRRCYCRSNALPKAI